MTEWYLMHELKLGDAVRVVGTYFENSPIFGLIGKVMEIHYKNGSVAVDLIEGLPWGIFLAQDIEPVQDMNKLLVD